MAHDFDVSTDFSLSAVVRGARNEAHARSILRKLAEAVENANECLRGDDYGQPLVTEFSINFLNDELIVEPLEEAAAETEGC